MDDNGTIHWSSEKSLKSEMGKAHRIEIEFVPLFFYIDFGSCNLATLFISSDRFGGGQGDVDSLKIYIYSIISSVNKNRFTFGFFFFWMPYLFISLLLFFIALARISKTM